MPKEQIMHSGLPVSCEVEDVAVTGDRPNILLISMDQCRADWLATNGHEICQTPHMDALAGNGVNFRQAMSECSVCCPARRILMTGLDPYGIHMYQNRDLQPFPEGPKLAEQLAAVGYQCHAVGKMHVWPPRLRMGFHDIEVNEEGRTAGHPYPDDYQQFVQEAGQGPSLHAHGMGNNQYGFRASPVPEWATTTGWTGDRACRFLRRRDPTRPFLLYASFDKPHPPLTPPQEFYDIYRDKVFPEPVVGDWVQRKKVLAPDRPWQDRCDRRPDVVQETLRAYAASITHIDSRIGQLVGTLRETGVLMNTWIIVTADHGDMTMDHHKRAKGSFLAGSCSVPFIIAPPTAADGTFPASMAGSIDDHPVGLQDVMPTILDLCGAGIPAGIPGRSLVPLMKDPGSDWREILCGVVGSHYGARDGRYRYQWHGEHDVELLFDQLDDPKDLHDLSDDPAHAEVKARLRKGLIEWMAANDDLHVEDGDLVPVPVRVVGDNFSLGYSNGPWNNRGWRG